MPSAVKAFRGQDSKDPSTAEVDIEFEEDPCEGGDGVSCEDYSEDSDCSSSSSATSASTATPTHNNKQIVSVEGRQPTGVILDEDIPVTKWFKFKRKTKVSIYHSITKIQFHLIMCIKCILSTLLVLATVHFSFPQSSHRVIPQQFFAPHSLVKDYYEGELQSLAERLQFTELAFVMYYAPWDRESQEARRDFAAAARIMQDQVVFAAINCWQPESSCRTSHKMTSFPALVLHINTGTAKDSSNVLRESRALAYSGPRSVGHLVRFLTAALRPYIIVRDRRHLAALQLRHTAVVLAYIDPVTPSEGRSEAEQRRAVQQFAVVYRAALHWLEYDKRAEVAWGVITDASLARQLGLATNNTEKSGDAGRVGPHKLLPTIVLVILDVNYVFNGSLKSSSEPRPLLDWVSGHLTGGSTSAVPGWLEVAGSKSLALSNVLHRGPALLLFAPDCPHHDGSEHFDLVRGLWLQHSLCPNMNGHTSSRAGKVAAFLLESQERQDTFTVIRNNTCRSRRAGTPPVLLRDDKQQTARDGQQDHGTGGKSRSGGVADTEGRCSALESEEDATQKQCNHGHFTCHRFMPFFMKPGSRDVSDLVWSLVDGACQALFGYSAPSTPSVTPSCPSHGLVRDSCKSPLASLNTSISNSKKPQRIRYQSSPPGSGAISGSIQDERVAQTLSWWEEEECRKLSLLGQDGHRGKPNTRADSRSWEKSYNVTGGSCGSNRTMQFGVLDSNLHWDLARRWGLNVATTHSENCSLNCTDGAGSTFTGAVIIDLLEEAHYILSEEVTSHSLTAFLYNFTHGVLDRSELSHSAPSLYREDYTGESGKSLEELMEAATDQTYRKTVADEVLSAMRNYRHRSKISKRTQDDENIDNRSDASGYYDEVESDTKSNKDIIDDRQIQSDTNRTDKKPERPAEPDDNTPSFAEGDQPSAPVLFIRELTADTYHNATHTLGQSLLVLHYSRSCGHCTVASHMLLTVASHFAEAEEQHNCDGIISVPQFARIDVSANTLPWNLNFAALPFFIFYPAYSKSSSRVFDPRVPLTATNLLRFIAAQLASSQALRLALSGCSPACVEALHGGLPSLTAQHTQLLMRATARYHRISTSVAAMRQQTTAAGLKHGSAQYRALLLERGSVADGVAAARQKQRYLLQLQDFLRKYSSLVDRGSQRRREDTSLREMLQILLQVYNL